MMHILLGITGGIAAYKSADLANALTKRGHAVDAVMTKNAAEFITPLTISTLTKRRVYTDSFERVTDFDVEHIGLAKAAELVLIAPATANFIGKVAAGIADDLLTTVVMAAHKKPAVICPAMNTAMYENPIVRDNIAKLAKLGYRFVEPREALLACGDLGRGALADMETILGFIESL
ncbi:MAG: phosphopantothenoylcysteine decarboxylase [Clostridiales Family XIII bacterium]|nr:phosphopantothenoylcysteine decarboxylase [Clostridiales Family XIII bacterium]